MAPGEDFENSGYEPRQDHLNCCNANFGEINSLLAQGRDMEYIARHYNKEAQENGTGKLPKWFVEDIKNARADTEQQIS